MDGDRLNTRLCPHFGRTPWFVIYDKETGELETLPNTQQESTDDARCIPLERLDELGIDAVVCGGMGKRSLANFQKCGLAVFISEKTMVWEVLGEIQAGKVTRLQHEEACESRDPQP